MLSSRDTSFDFRLVSTTCILSCFTRVLLQAFWVLRVASRRSRYFHRLPFALPLQDWGGTV